MKKVIAAVLCAAVLAVGAWAGLRAWEGAQERTAAREKLYMAWDEYLAFRNEIDGVQLWMLGYLELYLGDSSWENLQRLQAAVAAGGEALRSVDAVQFGADRRTKDALSASSEELILVTESICAAPYELESARMLAQELGDFAQALYTYTLDHAAMEKKADYYGKSLRMEMEYTAYLTNKLLLNWRMKDRWEALRESYPVFAASSGEWVGEDKRLERLAEASRDELEEAFYSYQSVTQYGERMLEVMKKATESGQYDELRQLISLPKGVPTLFPWPTWENAEMSAAYCYGSGNDVRLIRAGDELTEPPTGCMMTCAPVTEGEFEAYLAQLQGLGFEGLIRDNEDGTRTMLVTDGAYSMTVRWSEAETILMRTEPMACMVSMLDYLALMQQ